MKLAAYHQDKPTDCRTGGALGTIAVVSRAAVYSTRDIRMLADWDVGCWTGYCAPFQVDLGLDARRREHDWRSDAALKIQAGHSDSLGVAVFKGVCAVALVTFPGSHCHRVGRGCCRKRRHVTIAVVWWAAAHFTLHIRVVADWDVGHRASCCASFNVGFDLDARGANCTDYDATLRF